jgi:hypothetical protein
MPVSICYRELAPGPVNRPILIKINREIAPAFEVAAECRFGVAILGGQQTATAR